MNNSEKRHLIDRIREVQGLTEEERYALLGLLKKDKKYGLVWEEKEEDIEEKLRDELPVLIERNDEKVHSIISDNPDAPNHLIIEGDNLAALMELTYTHSGKIDVIYIDPPYNTGNKDFVYNDSYVDKEDSFRHSKWLSFISKRLKIAKSLLSDRGVIFISIDDNEQANLKILCDEFFGENNFISLLPRITKSSGKTTDKIAMNHDYVMIYARSKSECIIQGLPHDDEGFKFIDEFFTERGRYKLNQTLDYDSLSYSDSLDYPIEIDGEIFFPGGSVEKYHSRKAGNHKRADWAWRWSKDLFEYGKENGFIVIKRSKNGSRIYTKTYQGVTLEKTTNGYTLIKKDRLKPIQSIDLIDTQFSNDNAKKELSNIFENTPFDYPKPTSILRYLLPTIPQVNYILDFFAGSGTTLHATMQLNKEDGGHRQCILCTNNENNICEEVTYERNKRVIEGYTKPNGEYVEGLKDNNLRYYRTEFLPRERTQANLRELAYKSTNLLCIKEDLYIEKSKFGEIKLNPSGARYFEDKGRGMLIIYMPEFITAFVEQIRKMEFNSENPLKVYVYSPGRYAFNDEFESVADKIKLYAIPESIIEAMVRVLPDRKEEKS